MPLERGRITVPEPAHLGVLAEAAAPRPATVPCPTAGSVRHAVRGKCRASSSPGARRPAAGPNRRGPRCDRAGIVLARRRCRQIRHSGWNRGRWRWRIWAGGAFGRGRWRRQAGDRRPGPAASGSTGGLLMSPSVGIAHRRAVRDGGGGASVAGGSGSGFGAGSSVPAERAPVSQVWSASTAGTQFSSLPALTPPA